MKIRTAGAEVFRADGLVDRYDESNNRFSQFCEKRSKQFADICIAYGMPTCKALQLIVPPVYIPLW